MGFDAKLSLKRAGPLGPLPRILLDGVGIFGCEISPRSRGLENRYENIRDSRVRRS